MRPCDELGGRAPWDWEEGGLPLLLGPREVLGGCWAPLPGWAQFCGGPWLPWAPELAPGAPGLTVMLVRKSGW